MKIGFHQTELGEGKKSTRLYLQSKTKHTDVILLLLGSTHLWSFAYLSYLQPLLRGVEVRYATIPAKAFLLLFKSNDLPQRLKRAFKGTDVRYIQMVFT